MTAKQFKGALLEYIVRLILSNCGFRSVIPDGHYIYQQQGSGLCFINGKGAAHDADVLMNPPMQLPFSYPSRLLFECKAYRKNVGLGVLRGALGLRYDINEFEIVTEDSINERRNNNRATYAISGRDRYNYQVGVASVKEFSRPAFEYAANNKIPLISLRWFLSEETCELFDSINEENLSSISSEIKAQLYNFLKNRIGNHRQLPSALRSFTATDEIMGRIMREVLNMVNKSLVGLNDFGDLFFLFGAEDYNEEILDYRQSEILKARIHYWSDQPGTWYLNIGNQEYVEGRERHYKFFLPDRIMKEWGTSSLSSDHALDLKEQFFSRVYIFGASIIEGRLPFKVLEIDRNWLNDLRA